MNGKESDWCILGVTDERFNRFPFNFFCFVFWMSLCFPNVCLRALSQMNMWNKSLGSIWHVRLTLIVWHVNQLVSVLVHNVFTFGSKSLSPMDDEVLTELLFSSALSLRVVAQGYTHSAATGDNNSLLKPSSPRPHTGQMWDDRGSSMTFAELNRDVSQRSENWTFHTPPRCFFLLSFIFFSICADEAKWRQQPLLFCQLHHPPQSGWLLTRHVCGKPYRSQGLAVSIHVCLYFIV